MSGLYSYTPTGDVTGARRLTFYQSTLFSPPMLDYLLPYSSVLDVGVGNGRHYKLWLEHFDTVWGIDKSVKNHFADLPVTHIVSDFETYEFNRTFDVVAFICSFYLFRNKKKIFSKALSLADHLIVIVDDVKWEDRKCGSSCYNLDDILSEFGLGRKRYIERKIGTRFSFIQVKKEL